MYRLQSPNLIALDIDSSRVRATVAGSTGRTEPIPLAGDSLELMMAISLENREPQVGTAGARLLRRMPHLVCHDFLACLETQRQWRAGRHRWSANLALKAVLTHLQPFWSGSRAVGLALPSYLEHAQVQAALVLATEVGMPVAGAIPACLILAEAAYAQNPWTGPALILEADDHALTWTVVAAEGGEIRRLGSHVLPHLGIMHWKERLLNWIADTCIRQSRRDPRAYPEIEQMLFEQLGRMMTTQPQGQILELVIQRDQWYHNLLLRFEHMSQQCAPQIEQAVAAMDQLMTAIDPPGLVDGVVVSWSASQLPGLIAAVESHWEKRRVARAADPRDEEEPEARAVTVLPAGAVAESLCSHTPQWIESSLAADGFPERLALPVNGTSNGHVPRPASPLNPGVAVWHV